MEERDWTILKMLYEEKSITKTAKLLYISQPALTYRLQQLEKEFKTKIVYRGKKGVEFTPQGEYLVNYAKEMLLQLRKTKEVIQNMDKRIQGTLRLGVSGNFARYQLPPLIKKFLAIYPDVEIHLKTGWSSEITQKMYKEEIHIGVIRGDHSWHEQKLLLTAEPICLVSKKKIDTDQLPTLPRIHYKTDPSLQTVIDQWWQERFDQPPFITMEVDRIDTCKEMVSNSLGYAIFPKACLTESDDLYYENLTTNDHQVLIRNTWVIYRNNSVEIGMIRAFTDFIKEINHAKHS